MLAFKSSRVHYKQAIDLKKSGYTENDVMIHAYPIWKEDEGSDFTPSTIPRQMGQKAAKRKEED